MNTIRSTGVAYNAAKRVSTQMGADKRREMRGGLEVRDWGLERFFALCTLHFVVAICGL